MDTRTASFKYRARRERGFSWWVYPTGQADSTQLLGWEGAHLGMLVFKPGLPGPVGLSSLFFMFFIASQSVNRLFWPGLHLISLARTYCSSLLG